MESWKLEDNHELEAGRRFVVQVCLIGSDICSILNLMRLIGISTFTTFYVTHFSSSIEITTLEGNIQI